MSQHDVDIHFADEVPEGFFQAHRQYVVSTDGRRVLGNLHGTWPQKRARSLDDLGDVYGDWMPPDDEGGDDSAAVHAMADTVTSYDVCPDEEENPGKRKRYTSSDTPMQLWHPLASQYLDALLRREGLGNSLFKPGCSCCGAKYVDGADVRLFQCDQCGPFLQCRGCLLARHMLGQLHTIKEWNGRHWVEARLSGRAETLGLVYQVGHDGHPCEFPGREQSMVVMDVTGIHTIHMRFCGCEKATRVPLGTVGQLLANGWYPVTAIDPQTCATLEALEFYRMLSVVGNLNVHDFVGSLERKMDPLRMSSVLDQYKVFGRKSRQYAFLQHAKRAGCGHTSDGLDRAELGSLAVLCWACPHNKKNLTEEWRDVEPKYWLKNRLCENEHQDPSLGSGLGYFVVEKAYKAHVKNYVAERDVSSCIAFTALMQKETCMTSGLQCSGVDGCVCARHGVVRPQGLGDLKKGEQCYITAAGSLVRHCITLSYAEGVGRPDGEGIERTWAVLNPLGFSTKEMGNGAQHDTIEDKVDHLNFEKNIGQGDTLARKLVVTIAEHDKQVAAFVQVDSTLHKRLRKKWQDRIDAWLADRSQPNPYCLAGGKNTGPSEAAVLQELKEAEAREVAEGREVFADTKSTPVSFIKAGLVLEESQRHMKPELKGVMLVTADRASQIQEMCLSFLRKLRIFHAQCIRSQGGCGRASGFGCAAAEGGGDKAVAAFGIDGGDAAHGVQEGLGGGGGEGTSRTVWGRARCVAESAACANPPDYVAKLEFYGSVASKYRHARSALIELKGAYFAPHFKVLEATDLNTNVDNESDTRSRRKLARLGSSKRSHNEPVLAVRVEWSKAKARRDRWVEEVQLLREEMKRVLRMLCWTSQRWASRVSGREDIDPELHAGLAAYARRQIYVHRLIAEQFEGDWRGSMTTAAQNVVERDGQVYRELLGGTGVDQVPELGIAEAEAMST
ncbi:hypothetical protein K438DRAFT_1788310 [Mycena galopus ATCC 62051]|nr:hypothetical protein K438DRAFT_1788310 [Mycena galopus ATCC 62051]